MHLIFDFDGTLVDSFCCVVEKFNILASEFNFRPASPEEIETLKNFSSREFIKHFKIPLYKIPAILYQAKKYFRDEMHKLSPFVGIPQLLKDLFDAGFSLGVVTSNSESNVTSWLVQNKINQYFSFIHNESNFFGKKNTLKKVIRLNKIKKHHSFYIGDETRDIEAAKQCGIPSIAVTWGFNSEKILSKFDPNYIVHSPEDILKIALEHSIRS